MKAAWYERNGAALDVLIVGELPKPQPGPGEVLVRVHVSGVNPSDVKGRRGQSLPGPKVVPHSDGAGIIEEVGEGVLEKRIGERVWLWNGQWKRAFGTAAEYIALPARQAVNLPEGVDFAVGACLGIPGLTAMHAINLLDRTKDKTVLLIGAASAVGYYATRIATARGARVIGTASAEKAGHARSAGAAEIIDYKNEDVAARVLEMTDGNGADAVVDIDFSTTAGLLSAGILAPRGEYVCYGSNVSGENVVPFGDLLFRSLTLQFFLVYDLREDERATAVTALDTMLGPGQLVGNVVVDLIN